MAATSPGVADHGIAADSGRAQDGSAASSTVTLLATELAAKTWPVGGSTAIWPGDDPKGTVLTSESVDLGRTASSMLTLATTDGQHYQKKSGSWPVR
jgi:hypothetical protein